MSVYRTEGVIASLSHPSQILLPHPKVVRTTRRTLKITVLSLKPVYDNLFNLCDMMHYRAGGCH